MIKMLMSREHRIHLCFDEKGFKLVPLLRIGIETVAGMMPFPRIGVKRMVEKDKFMFFDGFRQNVFELRELFPKDLFFLIVYIRIKNDEE